MDIAKAVDFVRANNRGVLITRRRDGSPQASPVVAGVDGEGRIAVSSRETAMKVRNLRRSPKASYCGFVDGFFGEWAQVDGTATIISLPDAMDGLMDLYRAIAGEHEDWDDYRAAMTRERRVIIAITPERAGPDISG